MAFKAIKIRKPSIRKLLADLADRIEGATGVRHVKGLNFVDDPEKIAEILTNHDVRALASMPTSIREALGNLLKEHSNALLKALAEDDLLRDAHVKSTEDLPNGAKREIIRIEKNLLDEEIKAPAA